MQEKLIIKNFGGIKNAEIEINEFNVFIGPQASGKSIIAKLLYYFKKLPSEISTAINKNIIDQKSLNNLLIEDFKKYFPSHSYPSNNFSISYETKYKFISVNFINSQIKIDYSTSYYTALIEIKNDLTIKKEKDPLYQLSGDNFFTNYFDKIPHEVYERNDHIFIPAGRSFFANIKKDIFSFITNKINIDPFLLEFGREYVRISNYLLYTRHEKLKNYQLFDKNTRDILKGKIVQENDIEYLLHTDNRKVELLYTSSGQQEILPLIMILDFFMPKYMQNTYSEYDEGITAYIEEPEAHIFPSAQKQIMELITLVKNTSNFNRQFIITTHSPYILTSLNNMMYAGYLDNKLKNTKEKEKLYKKLPKELILNPKLVNAYSLKDGKIKSIINKKNHLIDADYLDQVSDDIALEFDGLLDVEFEK